MQFHLNGFRPGDPEVADPAPGAVRHDPDRLPDEVDVLIVGTGPAGLTLAAQLAAFPDIRTAVVERKEGPLQMGQADGIACRTMEMFEAFEFSERVLKEGSWVNEVTFWRPRADDPSRIERHGRVQDTEDGLSEFPHVVLNQARIHDFYLESMRNSPSRLEPHYARRFAGLTVEPGGGRFPVGVRLERTDGPDAGRIETVRARYVVGCDGARSDVRKAIGLELTGQSANQAWGVMDLLVVTDFPDIRFKSAIQSAGGSIVVIPREGSYLVRLYVEMDKLGEDERVGSRKLGVEQLIEKAERILHPYTLQVKEVPWWSVYEIGQRICERYDDSAEDTAEARAGGREPHVFIAGDACHTHSPKAGQGMNFSMQDAFNLGWKLAAVLRGQAAPALLRSYSGERQPAAKQLLDFDREWSKMISDPAADPKDLQRYFERHGRFTAGLGTRYTRSTITGDAAHQALATGFEVGTRFHSAPVVRVADARPLQLGHVGKADGRWRFYAFAGAGDLGKAPGRLRALCDFLDRAPASPLRHYTRPGQDIDAVFDLRAILQAPHAEIDLGTLPALLLPRKGRLGLIDYEKVFTPDFRHEPDVYDARGIDRAEGALIVVRPDQYVALVLPLDAHDSLANFFAGFMLPH